MAMKPKKTAKTEEITIKGVKGFDKNLQCRGYQFEIGKTYEQPGKIIVCENGFHAVTGSPFDAWNHYPILADDGSLNRWAEVTLSGQTSAKDEQGDSKIAAGKITIDVELHLPEFIRRAVAWVVEATKGKGDDPSGNYARIGSSGDYAQIGSSGNSARIGSSGNSARIGSSGNYARIGSSGNSARIKVEGSKSVVASAGHNASVEGVDGTWVCLAEFNDAGDCVGFATGCIGRDGLLPGVRYVAKGGKLVAAE